MIYPSKANDIPISSQKIAAKQAVVTNHSTTRPGIWPRIHQGPTHHDLGINEMELSMTIGVPSTIPKLSPKTIQQLPFAEWPLLGAAPVIALPS